MKLPFFSGFYKSETGFITLWSNHFATLNGVTTELAEEHCQLTFPNANFNFPEANFIFVKRRNIKECRPSFGSTVRVAHSSHTHKTIAAWLPPCRAGRHAAESGAFPTCPPSSACVSPGTCYCNHVIYTLCQSVGHASVEHPLVPARRPMTHPHSARSWSSPR